MSDQPSRNERIRLRHAELVASGANADDAITQVAAEFTAREPSELHASEVRRALKRRSNANRGKVAADGALSKSSAIRAHVANLRASKRPRGSAIAQTARHFGVLPSDVRRALRHSDKPGPKRLATHAEDLDQVQRYLDGGKPQSVREGKACIRYLQDRLNQNQKEE